jgi:predicted N-acetyltransferase YhbS
VIEADAPILASGADLPPDVPGILACLRASFGDDVDEARWRHLHLANPLGPSVIVVARAEEGVIGHIASLRRRVRFFGTEYKVAHVIDTTVHPAWRRRGVFRDLVPASEAAVERAGLAASYGVANQMARHAAVKHERRRPLGPFPLLVHPLRPLATVAAVGRHYWERDHGPGEPAIPECAAAGPLQHPSGAPVLAEVGAGTWTPPQFDERHSRLFARADDLPPVAFVRDADHLRWRYPAAATDLYAQRDLVDGADVVATAILRLVAVAGIRLAFVMEWHWQRGAADAGRRLLADALRLARRAGAHGVAAMAPRGSVARRILQRLAFVPVPTRVIPQSVFPGIHARGELGNDPRWSIGSNWHFTWGDGLVL